MKSKHFVIFIHGVNTREPQEQPWYSSKMQAAIAAGLEGQSIDVQFIPLYWGDANIAAEQFLREELTASPVWQHLYMKELRLQQLVQFVGDAALYISRDFGSLVAEILTDQAINGSTKYGFDGLNTADPASANYIHLVTHSWGTIILFDLLFASRWNDPSMPGFAAAQMIRNALLGHGTERDYGLHLGSITTMGSPIALFSLMTDQMALNGSLSWSHDIARGLTSMLRHHSSLESGKISWNNFVHPGDLIAWPIEHLLPNLLPGISDSLVIQDVLVEDAGPPKLFEQFTATAIWKAGDAHHSYWNSKAVVWAITAAVERLQSR